MKTARKTTSPRATADKTATLAPFGLCALALSFHVESFMAARALAFRVAGDIVASGFNVDIAAGSATIVFEGCTDDEVERARVAFLAAAKKNGVEVDAR